MCKLTPIRAEDILNTGVEGGTRVGKEEGGGPAFSITSMIWGERVGQTKGEGTGKWD